MQTFLVLITLLAVASSNEHCPQLFHDIKPKSSSCDLRDISFSHSLTSYVDVRRALETNARILNAKIVDGFYNDELHFLRTETPVVGMKRGQISSMSLDNLLEAVVEFNRRNHEKKAVKIKFHDMKTFISAYPTIRKHYHELQSLLIVHANIISGPVDSNYIPINPMYFLTMMKKLPKAMISAGWTTKYKSCRKGCGYLFEELKAMALALIYKDVKQPVTFAVRATFAVHSHNELMHLIGPKFRDVSLTIWSKPGDSVNRKKLKKIVESAGKDKVMLDDVTRLEWSI